MQARGRQSTGMWALPEGVQPMGMDDALLLKVPELKASVAEMTERVPSNCDRDWLCGVVTGTGKAHVRIMRANKKQKMSV